FQVSACCLVLRLSLPLPDECHYQPHFECPVTFCLALSMSFNSSELNSLSTSSAYEAVKRERRHSRKLRTLLKKVHVFKHNHLIYKTCFGAIHVKTATWFVGLNALIVICTALFYCIFTSQEQRRPKLKLYAIPVTAMAVCLMFLFVGMIQKKPKHLYPFIALQVVTAFATAVTMGMIGISVACNTKYILRHLVDVTVAETQYKRSALVLLSILGSTLFLQLWYLRSVCNCFRYFTDIERFKQLKEQGLYT
uniref:Transmembrane protein n=1 Tax=Haemonchus contortus TaxID=6289 RepID=A0A7I4YHM3_HAECO